MAAEIMICTPAIRALIRDDKVHQIESSMQAGKKYGMQTLNDALYQLYMSREVTKDECLRVTSKPHDFLRSDWRGAAGRQGNSNASTSRCAGRSQSRRAPLRS